MSDIEAGFLKAIAAAPDDDTPRLVYADWLDEHGGESLDLTRTGLTEEAASRILTMPNLSALAKFTGLRSAGFRTLATQARREAEAGTPPRP